MSTETVSWKTGACQASVSRRAIVLRIDVSSISSTSPAGAATAAGAAFGAATAPRSTSSATIRPSGPLPDSVAMSIPFSRASLRASGEALTRPSGRTGASATAAVAASAVAAAASWPRARWSSIPGAEAPSVWASSCSSTAASSDSASAAGRGAVPGGDVLALAADEGDRPADLDLARVDDDLQQDAVGLGLDLLRHLVRVELVERLALLDRLALALQPLDDRAGLHPLAQPRELDLGRHYALATVRFTASSTSAACGTTHCSIAGENASGANFAPTRSIGASR